MISLILDLSFVLAALFVAARSMELAIVGAGIGGSAAAFFARETFGSDVRITVFEKQSRVGGRVHDLTIGGVSVEAGASIYHKLNKYVSNFTSIFNLKSGVAAGGRMGIWNGHSFVFEESDYKLINIAKFLLRYGMSPLRLKWATEEVLGHWQRTYELLQAGESWSTVEAWLRNLRLDQHLRLSLADYLLSIGCTQLFVDELITAVTRVQYGQEPTLHALVGLVSLVGAEDGNLLYIEGGNDQLVASLLAAAEVDIKLESPVRKVEKAGCRFKLDQYGEFDAETKNLLQGIYLLVLLATPLEDSGLYFDGFGSEFTRPPAREFRTTHTTFVKADGIKPSYFDATSLSVDTVLTTEGLPFNSIAYKGRMTSEGTQQVYKGLLSSLFINPTVAASFPWAAYPVLTPLSSSLPHSFVLHPNLFYINAFESAISCMETSVLAAKNVVNALAKASQLG